MGSHLAFGDSCGIVLMSSPEGHQYALGRVGELSAGVRSVDAGVPLWAVEFHP